MCPTANNAYQTFSSDVLKITLVNAEMKLFYNPATFVHVYDEIKVKLSRVFS